MKFHEYKTLWEEVRDRLPRHATEEKFYAVAMAGGARTGNGLILAEGVWKHLRRPYYQVYPAIIPALLNLRLDIQTSLIHTPEVRIDNIADFERHYDAYDLDTKLKQNFDFKPDMVIVAIGENVPALASEDAKTKFKASFTKLLSELKNSGQPAILVRSCFWADKTKDEIMRQACQAVGGVVVDIGGLGKVESNYARSERTFAHSGVAAHPGDKGMQAIADAMLKAVTSQATEGQRNGGRQGAGFKRIDERENH